MDTDTIIRLVKDKVINIRRLNLKPEWLIISYDIYRTIQTLSNKEYYPAYTQERMDYDRFMGLKISIATGAQDTLEVK